MKITYSWKWKYCTHENENNIHVPFVKLSIYENNILVLMAINYKYSKQSKQGTHEN